MKFLGLIFLTAGLIFAVSRVTDLKSVLNLPKAAERRLFTWELVSNSSPNGEPRVSTWELIFGNRRAPSPSATPTSPIIASPKVADGNYKSAVTSRGNYADLKIIDDGAKVADFTDRFDIPRCNLKNYAVKGPASISVTNGNFSFDQNGFVVSGKIDGTNSLAITSQLSNYPVPGCGSEAKVNVPATTYRVSLL